MLLKERCHRCGAVCFLERDVGADAVKCFHGHTLGYQDLDGNRTAIEWRPPVPDPIYPLAYELTYPRDETIGQRIRRLRLALEMTLTDLASDVGVSRQRIEQVERKTGGMTERCLAAYAAALGCSPSYLRECFEETEEMK